MASEELDAILSDLEAVSERLADHALALLHEALGSEDPRQSPAARAEKVVTRARRSVEKAASLVRSLGSAPYGEDG